MSISSDYQVGLGFFYVACCSSQIPSFYPNGSSCEFALKDPKAREALAELPSSQTVLVANCAGQYQPYTGRQRIPTDSQKLRAQSRRIWN
jgi:hypothetical protein